MKGVIPGYFADPVSHVLHLHKWLQLLSPENYY